MTGLQSALDAKADDTQIGAASGIAPLGADSKVPSAYLPAYVDDVLEYANLAALPVTGVAGIIYVTLNTGRTYRWSGSAYTEILASPGTTDAITEGSTNLFFTNARAVSAVQAVNLNLGSNSLSAAGVNSSDNIVLAGTKRFYIDGVGGVGGDTYIVESSANVVDHYAGGVKTLSLNAAGAAVVGTLSATGQLSGSSLSIASSGVPISISTTSDVTAYMQVAIDTGGQNTRYIAGCDATSTNTTFSGSLSNHPYHIRVNNAAVGVWDTAGLAVTGTLSTTGIVTIPAGTLATPALRVSTNAATGLYFPTANQVALSANGNASATATTSGLSVSGTVGLSIVVGGNSAVASLNWGTNGTGLYGGATTVSVTAATINVATFDSTGLTVAGALTATGSVGLAATQKLYLDGVAINGNTYIVESAANVMDLYAGGAKTLSLTGTGASISGTLSTTKTTAGDVATFTNGGTTPLPIYLYSSSGIAGISVGASLTDRAIYFQSALLKFYHTGDVAAISATGLALAATKKLCLDGIDTTGNTYLVESSADVLDTYVGGVNTLKSTPVLTTVLGALSTPDLSVAVVDKTVFPGVIIDTFLYDTEKDSDGGAWRKRCAHTSWENETLSGNWLGSAANEAAARAISGATTGSYYYDTTALGFYTLNAGSGKTATYRGNVRQFPAKVLITVESARVVLWDLTQAGAPMWMAFASAGGSSYLYAGTQTGASAVNGIVALSFSLGLRTVNFPADIGELRDGNFWYKNAANITNRNSTSLGYLATSATYKLVATACNDVAMTVLPNAPVDVATGLPVPTIAVATNGGVSVIKDDGTVSNSANTSVLSSVAFDKHSLSLHYGYAAAASNAAVHINQYPEWLTTGFSNARYWGGADFRFTSAGYSNDLAVANKTLVIGNVYDGVYLIRTNPTAKTGGSAVNDLRAQITKDYNSGWLSGDVRGAWLADTVAETLTGAELVTNGGPTFTVTTGWTAAYGAVLSVAAGLLVITEDGSDGSQARGITPITTVVGKTYTASVNIDSASTGGVLSATNEGSGSGPFVYSGSATSGVLSITFTATATVTYVTVTTAVVTGADYVKIINITCRLADVDRSVKAKGLQIFGSLTKAAVASGAALMGYSGFSAANYLEQPYNSDLDFGTGDFCYMGWAKVTATGTGWAMVSRGVLDTNGDFSFQWSAAANLVLYAYASGIVNIVFTSIAPLTANTMFFIAVARSGTTFTIYVNGIVVATATSAASFTGTTKLALGKNNTASGATLALWRATATAPSAEQIKHIYETERALFEANAQCCLAGTSNAVTALAYDEDTDLLHVGTSYGRSAFKGLVRVASEATPVGAITALSAGGGGGFIAQGGASGADIYIPAYTLREELSRKAEQTARLGSVLEPILFTATASQTAFQLSIGWTPKYVYRNGLLLREGATEDYILSFDGFRWTATLADASIFSDHITVMGVRSNG